MTTIGITGADGFIGTHLCTLLDASDRSVVRIVRRPEGLGKERRVIRNIHEFAHLRELMQGVEVLIHLAGRAHVLRENAADPSAEFQLANVEMTKQLAYAAKHSGVRRFVFVSSIGVNGSETRGTPFCELDEPRPTEPYAKSKLEAEIWLRSYCQSNELELVIVRPPLVYGPAAPGNFRRLVRLAASGIPLPIAGLHNKRSLIGVTNLVDFLMLCSEHPAAPGEIFLIAEPDARSTPQLLAALARALGKPNRMFPLPERLLRVAVTAIGLRREFGKFCASLEISSEKARAVLGWLPKTTFDEEIERIAIWYYREFVRA